MNKKNEVAVIETKPVTKKPVIKKSTKKVAPVTAVAVVENVTTSVANNAVTNKPVKNLLLTFDETMQLMSECGIGSKSHTKNYRIINGGSSIHVLKTKYRIYATTIDFDLCASIKSSDIQLLKNDNIVDVKRPHTIVCSTVDTLKKVFECISKNTLNAPC